MLSKKRLTGTRQARRFVIIALFVFLSALSTFAQRRERLVDSWKPLHYDVNLTFNDQLTEIAARTDISVEVVAQNLTEVDLDLATCQLILYSYRERRRNSSARQRCSM